MAEKTPDSAGKTQVDLRRAIRRDWFTEHKGTIVGVGACVVAAGAVVGLLVARPWVDEAHVLDRAAAVVDGDKIMEKDVADYIDKYRRYIGKTADADWATFMDENSLTADSMRTQALQRLEQQHIVRKAASEAGITVTAEEVDAKVAEERERAGLTEDDAAWSSWLESMGYTADEYRSEMEYGLIEEKYVDTQVAPSDPSDWYVESEASSDVESWTGRKGYVISWDVDSTATASEVGDAQAQAENVIADLGESPSFEDFKKAADEASKSKGVSQKELQWDCLTTLSSPIQGALDGLAAGKMAGAPVRDADGIHIVFCTETYLAGEDGTIDAAAMPDAIMKALRAKVYKDINKNPRTSFLSTLTYNHSVNEESMPKGLPYDVDMSQSTYHAEDEAVDDSTATTITSDDGNTEVSAVVDDGNAEGESDQAVSPTDPTVLQTYADYSEDSGEDAE